MAPPTTEGPRHRGSLQVQGRDLGSSPLSYSWAQDEPLKARVALEELEKLKQLLSDTQLKQRNRAFQKAAAWIRNVSRQGGIDAPLHSKSFFNWSSPGRGQEPPRVDIEVHKGKAFVL